MIRRPTAPRQQLAQHHRCCSAVPHGTSAGAAAAAASAAAGEPTRSSPPFPPLLPPPEAPTWLPPSPPWESIPSICSISMRVSVSRSMSAVASACKSSTRSVSIALTSSRADTSIACTCASIVRRKSSLSSFSLDTNSGPMISFMPHCVTMYRAISVACRKSSVAPLETSPAPNTSSSATVPPMHTRMRASICVRLMLNSSSRPTCVTMPSA
mmetsp:Transcript_33509/g.99743  ORF Transcript_33509/g.99743 Transcript_33509/m.99743 type:complete len:212 (+) Transcript_33509:399-1034(+)